MALTCQKCRQAVPHESDSWCLGCSAAEALTAELRNTWGSPGSRALATDLLVSGLRQVRALRRLGLAAGANRAALGAGDREGRETPRGSLPPPEPVRPPSSLPREAPAPAAASTEVKAEEDEEEESESEGSGAESPCTGAFPKCKAEPLPRRRTSEGGRSAEPAIEEIPRPERKDCGEERDRPGHGEDQRRGQDRQRGESVSHRHSGGERRRKEKRERSRSRKKRSSRNWTHPHQGDSGPKKKKNRRAGSKHQRLYRAAEDPYRRFHHRRPDGYWDQEFKDFR